MSPKKKEEVVESDKLTPRDKKEIQEGACVNCAIATLVFVVLMMTAALL
jgi:hypothetical protein